MQLKPPVIDRYSGDRSATLDLSLSIDRRLRATGQYSTMAGLDDAVGQFTGDAATWFRFVMPAPRCQFLGKAEASTREGVFPPERIRDLRRSPDEPDADKIGGRIRC